MAVRWLLEIMFLLLPTVAFIQQDILLILREEIKDWNMPIPLLSGIMYGLAQVFK